MPPPGEYDGMICVAAAMRIDAIIVYQLVLLRPTVIIRPWQKA